MNLKFSANLGFLWNELSLPDAIRAAANVGFDAVECHWPYEVPAKETRSALAETGLQMLGLNTRPGNLAAGEFGLAAIAAAHEMARTYIEEAIEYASIIGAQNIHVMAGKAEGKEAQAAFVEHLRFACELAKPEAIQILIEPINGFDVPGYFLQTMQQAKAIKEEVGFKNIAIMFDCYHVARMGGDVLVQLEEYISDIGHVQFAGVPDRGPPDAGTLEYEPVFLKLHQLNYDKPLGAEYKPDGPTLDTLGWLERYKSSESILFKSRNKR